MGCLICCPLNTEQDKLTDERKMMIFLIPQDRRGDTGHWREGAV